ncbi:MAG: L,D-transpeptidase [Candidatus Staskawiczbacteria bacterium]|jgi:lipoprotein-anchoring transpeptidase ErfK/SrfK
MKSILIIALIVLAIAIAGLFFGYYSNKGTNTANPDQTPVGEAINTLSDVPDGDPQLAKQVKVDLSKQRVFLYENGQFVREFTISSGRIDTPTPTGSFNVVYKQENLFSKIAGCWLAFWVGFTNDGKYGFHETPVCEGIREGEDKMGTPDSAGCLRLKLGDAEQFYNWAEIGMKVEVY